MEVLRIALFISISASSALSKIDPGELKCLVCEQSINEMKKAVNLLDPSKKIDVGGYHLDAEGNYRSTKVISAAHSEILLSEIMDQICDKMENYVRATWKSNGTLTLLNLLDPSGGMNSKMSEVDIIQDDDLNKSLQYYCTSIMEENEDDVIKYFQEGQDGFVCSKIGLCKANHFVKEDL
ncbi:protein seele [Coccinella septempunctata]|uniref:protein seele n=1 Tax=Coccinella septempunctata TaxID=41139 RepID=UPI001D06A2E8|nr:protein seele [Coccinella septempunctata]